MSEKQSLKVFVQSWINQELDEQCEMNALFFVTRALLLNVFVGCDLMDVASLSGTAPVLHQERPDVRNRLQAGQRAAEAKVSPQRGGSSSLAEPSTHSFHSSLADRDVFVSPLLCF